MDKDEIDAVIGRRTDDDWMRAALSRMPMATGLSLKALKADAVLVAVWRNHVRETTGSDPDPLDFAESLTEAQAWGESERAYIPVNKLPSYSVLHGPDGLRWKHLSSKSYAVVNAAMGCFRSDSLPPHCDAFVLTGATGVPLAVLSFEGAKLLMSANTHTSAGINGGSVPVRLRGEVARAAAILGTRRAMGLIKSEIPDGFHRVDFGHGNACTVRIENGVIHDPTGPAVCYLNGAKEWWHEGRRHRDYGLPAVEHVKGHREFWRHGVLVDDPSDNLCEIAIALYAAAVRSPDGKFDKSLITWFIRDVHNIETSVKESGFAWDSPEAQRIINVELARNSGANYTVNLRATLASKCVRLAGLIATGRYACIPASERGSLLRLLDGVPKAALPSVCGTPENGLPDKIPPGRILAAIALKISEAPRGAIPVASDGPVEFLYAWRPSSRGSRTVFSAAMAPLDRLSVEEAPVFATLTRPDGGTLDLRRINGEPYRPILSPDSWNPISEAEFRAAAGSGAAWRDSPFFPKLKPFETVLAVPEYAESWSGRLNSSVDAHDEANSAAICVANAGHLVVVDGIVHRRTAEPTLAIVATEAAILSDFYAEAAARRHRLVWRLGDDLASFDNQATIIALSDRHATWSCFFMQRILSHNELNGRSSMEIRYAKSPSPPGFAFLPDGQDRAADILEDWSRIETMVPVVIDGDPRAKLIHLYAHDAPVNAPSDTFDAIYHHVFTAYSWNGGLSSEWPDIPTAAAMAKLAMAGGWDAELAQATAAYETIAAFHNTRKVCGLDGSGGRRSLIEALINGALKTLRDGPDATPESDGEILSGFAM